MNANLIPLEDFFRKPETIQVRLSPDGAHLAYMAPHERRLNIFVRNIETGVDTRITSATERDIAGYTWIGNQRLLYAQDRGGDENYRLYAVDHDGGNPLDLTPFDGVQCTIVDDLEDVNDEVLFRMNKRDAKIFDVYRLNVKTGTMTIVAENPGNIQEWFTDHDGKLRVAMTTDGVNTSLLYRASETDPWRTVATYDFKESATPIAFTFDNRSLYVTSNVGRDKAAIFEYDLDTGKEGRLVFEHPEVDVTSLHLSKHRKLAYAASFETDRRHYHFFDAPTEQLHQRVQAALPGHQVTFASHSKDESKRVVMASSDRDRGAYYLVEATNGAVEKLFDLSPWLDPKRLAPMRPITYRSRDGLTIHGYLTVPLGRAPGERVPLVVHPHGGPWARDSWQFDPSVQFLANRGYAVLQANFRGSTGYGRTFMEASFGEWGLTMQDDLSDGAAWAIDSGIADADRIAIFGGSYGGYATLSGVTKDPDLYCCGVSFVGVSNIFTWIEAIPPYWQPFREMIYEMVGHPERDRERLERVSPLFNVDRIKVPMFIAQGANDPRVPKAESDQIVAALRERGIEVEYMLKDNEGHGFQNEENNFDFFRAMERFLDQHLAGAKVDTQA